MQLEPHIDFLGTTPFKICIFSSSETTWGGSHIFIDSLCNYLNKVGIDTRIASGRIAGYSAPTMRIPSVTSLRRRLQVAIHMAWKLRRNKVRAIILDDLSSLWLAPIFRLGGFKVISLLHLKIQVKNEDGFGHSHLQYLGLLASSYFANHIYSVNEENLKTLPGKPEFVGNFVPDWFFDAKTLLPKKYDLAFVGRIAREKNVPLFIELIAEMRRSLQGPVRALIVGCGPDGRLIRRLIEKHGLESDVIMLPWLERSALPNIYDQVRCLVLTSYHEGFPTTILEAHARGVPVVTLSTAGYGSVFVGKTLPRTGLVFEKKDLTSPRAIQKISTLIAHHSEYRLACIQKARQFGDRKILGKIHQDLLHIMGDS